jgi:hypothetical protein
MDKWFKDILPDKDPYHNRGRDQMRKNGESGLQVPDSFKIIASPDAITNGHNYERNEKYVP